MSENQTTQTNTINTTNISTASSHSVRRRLTRDLIILVLLLITSFLILSYFYSIQIQKDITRAAIESAQKRVIEKKQQIFEPISNNLLLSKKWAELESLTPASDKQNTFNKRFIPVLETLPQISSVILSSSDGKEYFFTRKDNNWLSRYIDSHKNNNIAIMKLWNSNNKLIKEWHEGTTYQPLSRPWYKLAQTLDANAPSKWTTPYNFYTLQTPGVTGVTRWKDKHNISYILAFDVTLSDIAQSLSSKEQDKTNIAYLLSPNGEVILPPGNTQYLRGSLEKGSLFSPGDNSSSYIIFDSVTDWLKKQQTLDKTIVFSRNGQRWWYKIFSLDPRYHSLYAGVIVPEKKIREILKEKAVFILVGIVVILLLALGMAKFLVKKYAHQLKDLPKTTISANNFEDEIYELIRQGESETLEFKSTMRKNIKSGKFGKEIEIAWLKGLVGFMNTHGGILLIGVDDDGTILGIKADEFANEDKILLHFKNLLSQHIGLEFSNYLNLIINQIEGKTILVIECERANRPVFLYHKNEEDFYIRSGPASVKLSVSKVLKYVKNRY